MEGGNGGRRTLSEQIGMRDSSNNLGNLIKVREEDGNAPVAPNRTLLDIIREEDPGHRLAGGGHKIKWKSFKDRLRLRRSGAAWSSSSGHGHSVSLPVCPPPPPDVAEDAAEPDDEEPPTPESPGPVRVSLMTLLEQTDRYSVPLGGSSDGEVEEEEEEEDESGEEGEEGAEFVCCVCMVRHKGAAFIPCGHTFCRLCSRELWVGRGNCPLCNGYILEILDIF